MSTCNRSAPQVLHLPHCPLVPLAKQLLVSTGAMHFRQQIGNIQHGVNFHRFYYTIAEPLDPVASQVETGGGAAAQHKEAGT